MMRTANGHADTIRWHDESSGALDGNAGEAMGLGMVVAMKILKAALRLEQLTP
jgi:hypothetical protein